MFYFPTAVLVLMGLSFGVGLVLFLWNARRGVKKAWNRSVMCLFTIPFCIMVVNFIVQIISIYTMFGGNE